MRYLRLASAVYILAFSAIVSSTNTHMNPARRLFPICVSPLSFTHLCFGIVTAYGTSCVSTSRSPRRFSHRHFGFRNPYSTSCMSTVGSLRSFAHRHFGFDNPHALGAGRLAPLSHDSLVATSCSLINFSSRAFSRWVHMDPTCGSHVALSLSLLPLPPGYPFSSPRGWDLTPCPESIISLFKFS